MVDFLLYSMLEFASGFSPNLTTLLVLRALYGVAMGGEWGVGASLTYLCAEVQERSRLRLSVCEPNNTVTDASAALR
jgi:predicted MFS family arabinose efflux permease